MTIKRFMVILTNGDVTFKKVKLFTENGVTIATEQEEVRTYEKKTRTELDFPAECINRFENEFPDWADVLEWQMIGEEDFAEWVASPDTVVI